LPKTIERWKVAAVQMTSTAEKDKNLSRAVKLIRRAADAGSRLIALPENFAHLRREGERAVYRQDLDGELVSSMREEARRLGCYLLLGSFPERVARSRRVYNTSVLIGPAGGLLAVYRKIHLFDIEIRGGAVLKESRSVKAGDRVVVARTPLGRLGLSICYDLRFPELYRRQALRGAQLLFVPAAFTAFTGPHHWLPLLRARAIENQCWVVAPAQIGRHGPGRRSHGESAIIDPWGKVVRRMPKGQGFIQAVVDMKAVERVRLGLPCLEHVQRKLLC
jgi:predicted amidohydrolase